MNRAKKSIRNIVASIVNKLTLTLLPLVIRTIIIYKMGEEYTGIGSLFTSILSVLSISELGFGTAVTYSMYKPVSEHNINKVGALLKYYRKIYRIVGTIILLVGLGILPFLQYLINGKYPKDINISILYIIYLFNAAAGYFFGGYKRSLLIANQRNDVDYNVNTVANIITFLIQMGVLYIAPNYYLYSLIFPVSTIAINIINVRASNKLYPEYKCYGEINESEKKSIYTKVEALFINKIGTIIITSSDNIVISAFLGLTILTYYNNYYSIIYAFISITYMAIGAITSIIADGIIRYEVLENKKIFDVINFGVCILSGMCWTCLQNLLQPFMTIWMGKERLLSFSSIVLLCVYFYVWQARRAVIVFRDASGIWEKDKYRPLISGMVNVVLNIVLVNIIGLNGVMLSTIICMLFIDMPWESFVLYKVYFNEKMYDFWIKQVKYLGVTLIMVCLTSVVCAFVNIEGIIGIIVKGVLCIGIDIIVIFCIFRRNENIQFLINVINKIAD